MRFTTVLALLTILIAAVELCVRASRPERVVDHIGPGLDLYRAVSANLPAAGAIGFIATTDNSLFNTANYYVAQHALAPRVLLNPSDAKVEFVVTGADAVRNITSDPKLHGFQLVAEYDRGVKLFRRIRP
jgi:hypothetical protein